MCEEAEDRDGLRRKVGLTLAEFNAALKAIGQPPLETRADLGGQFDYFRNRLAPELLDGLRRLHMADYLARRPLDTYVERRDLAFIQFNPDWLLTHEELTENDVCSRAADAFSTLYGNTPDPSGELEPLEQVRGENRGTLGTALPGVMRTIFAWCRKRQQNLPPHSSGHAPEAIRCLNEKGLLDFERIVPPLQLPGILHAANLWPTGMPLSLDLPALGLTFQDLDAAEEDREEQKRRAALRQRQILFGGRAFDGADEADLEALAQAARAEISSGVDWTQRFRRAQLRERQNTPSGHAGGHGSSGRRSSPERNMTDAQRVAIGLLGEVRADEWLRAQYPDASVDWVSRNRRHASLGSDGDDDLGYDFKVTFRSGRRLLYEVKASQGDPCQFEIGSTEIRAALEAGHDSRAKVQFRILYIPNVSNANWRIFEMPNPMSPESRSRYEELGRGTLRFGFSQQY